MEGIDTTAGGIKAAIDGGQASGEPFRIKEVRLSGLDKELPCCTENLPNKSISSIDISLSEEEGADYMIAGMMSYEVFDANGSRINCWPVCQFTMSGQRLLRMRFMCGGTSRTTARRIDCKVLLKRR